MVEWWSGGVVEWWSCGVVELWSGGVVESWKSSAKPVFPILQYSNTPILQYSSFPILQFSKLSWRKITGGPPGHHLVMFHFLMWRERGIVVHCGMGLILFFDGKCAFCAWSVRWVARRDRRGRITYAPLQGSLAVHHGLARHAAENDGTMVVLREGDGRVFLRSDAWFEVIRALGGWWRVLTVLRVLPRWLRDGIYRWIARNRHRLPGRTATCGLPDPLVVKRLRE